jgi:shikimate dehydrogenase
VQIGAGGAGRATAFALMDLGVSVLVIHDRDAARANALTADLARHFGPPRCRLAGDLAGDIAAADGIVNADQMGMRSFPGNPVPVSALRATHWAADVISIRRSTPSLSGQRPPKAPRVLSGSGMCVHQAVAAFRLFTGVEPEAARLHRAFAAALGARAVRGR